MRHLKIFKSGTLTRTQNQNVGRIFPGHEAISTEDKALDDIAELIGPEIGQEGEQSIPPTSEPEPPAPERVATRYSLRSHAKAK